MKPERSNSLPAEIADFNKRSISKRFRIWQIPGSPQCSIVGTCLSRKDIGSLIRKGVIYVKPGTPEYDIHNYLVRSAMGSGTMAKLIEKTLDKKYSAEIAHVTRLRDQTSLCEFWEKSCAIGKVPGAYWALLSHRHTPNSLRCAAFG
ncbi:MAG: hypothetical protein AAFY56_12320, partial [Pseudomonadota bacterium]